MWSSIVQIRIHHEAKNKYLGLTHNTWKRCATHPQLETLTTQYYLRWPQRCFGALARGSIGCLLYLRHGIVDTKRTRPTALLRSLVCRVCNSAHKSRHTRKLAERVLRGESREEREMARSALGIESSALGALGAPREARGRNSLTNCGLRALVPRPGFLSTHVYDQ